MPYKNKADEIARGKKYRKEHAKEISTQRKIHYQENKKELNAKAKEFREKPENKAKIKASKRQYYIDHREELSVYYKQYKKDHREEIKQYRKNNRDKINKTERQYHKDHPEVGLRIQSKLYKKMGLSKWNLIAWTRVIRKDKNCSYCGSEKTLHSHHLIPKSKQPGLALNENNGIPLCDPCHKEHHMLNGVN